MKKSFPYLLLMVFLCLSSTLTMGQDENKSSIDVGADIFNRYVWRGLDFGSSPSIQPSFEYKHKSGFSIGSWGAFNFEGTYNEVDLYAGYEFKGISLTITDYFFPVPDVPQLKSERYFNYANETTGHLLEGAIGFEGPEGFPVYVMAATFLYGNDKNAEGKQNYSTYAEAGYSFETKAGDLQMFLGITSGEGLYGNTMGVVNLGISTTKNIKISDHFDLPVSASLITNPQASNIYFLLGFSF